MEPKEARLQFLKSTPGAHRFTEVDQDGNKKEFAGSVIGTLYIRKSSMENPPKSGFIKITIEEE